LGIASFACPRELILLYSCLFILHVKYLKNSTLTTIKVKS